MANSLNDFLPLAHSIVSAYHGGEYNIGIHARRLTAPLSRVNTQKMLNGFL